MDLVDPNFLQVIRLPLVVGDPAHGLREAGIGGSVRDARPANISAMNRRSAKPSSMRPDCAATDPNCASPAVPLIVTGILADLPHNTQLKADVLIPNTSAA